MRSRWLFSVGILTATLTTVSLVVIALGAPKVVSGDNAPQTPAEIWSSWSREAREEYVWGYVSGFREGKRAACSFYEEKVTPNMPHKAVPPENLPKAACLTAMPDFTAPYLQAYVDSITDYYAKYPRDRQAGLPRLMLELASPPGLTVDQIHKKLTQ
jgi:hypothetical protein